MASHPLSPAIDASEQRLSHDEWWKLFDRLRLSQLDDYAKVGGPVAFLRPERDADTRSA